MVPTRGCSLGSTTMVREVPSASGLPGQSAAKPRELNADKLATIARQPKPHRTRGANIAMSTQTDTDSKTRSVPMNAGLIVHKLLQIPVLGLRHAEISSLRR